MRQPMFEFIQRDVFALAHFPSSFHDLSRLIGAEGVVGVGQLWNNADDASANGELKAIAHFNAGLSGGRSSGRSAHLWT